MYTYIYMATKTISILEDVYQELLKSKKNTESFSEEIRRLLKQKGALSECVGLWSWMPAQSVQNIEGSIQKRRMLGLKAKKEKSHI